MTPYEEMQQRQMAAAIAQATNAPISQQAASAAGMMPGMISQSAGTPDINAARQRASASTKGAEAKLAQQQAYANSLRGSKMPDGREVGPSGIYVQANAGDMTKYLVDQIGGGYLASQAGKAADELDVARTDVKLGDLELEDLRTDAANQFSIDERLAGQDFTSEEREAKQGFTQGLQESKLAAAAAIAQADRQAVTADTVAEAAEAALKGSTDMRKEFTGRPDVKDFQKVDSAFGKLAEVDTSTPSGQMSMVFQIMKMYDPNSSVREGEYATAQNTAGIPGKIMNAYNKAQDGTLLSPEQIRAFTATAHEIYTSQLDAYDQTASIYTNLADKYGFDPEDVLTVRPNHRDFVLPEDDPAVADSQTVPRTRGGRGGRGGQPEPKTTLKDPTTMTDEELAAELAK